MKASRHITDTTHIDTASGIFTSLGYWYQTSEEYLEEYAAGLLNHLSVSNLLLRADIWLKAPTNIALWCVPIGLLNYTPGLVIPVVLVVYFALSVLAPLYIIHSMFGVVRFLNFTAPQFLLYTIIGSYLAVLET